MKMGVFLASSIERGGREIDRVFELRIMPSQPAGAGYPGRLAAKCESDISNVTTTCEIECKGGESLNSHRLSIVVDLVGR